MKNAAISKAYKIKSCKEWQGKLASYKSDSAWWCKSIKRRAEGLKQEDAWLHGLQGYPASSDWKTSRVEMEEAGEYKKKEYESNILASIHWTSNLC